MKNETKMQRSVKSRILAVIAMLLLGISILTSLVVFTDFMEHTIYEESTAHLTEIYHQAKYSLQGTTQGRYLTGGVPPVRFSM